MNYSGIIRKTHIEITLSILFLTLLMIVIFMCNTISVNVIDLRNDRMKDSTQFYLESYPYSIRHLFRLHDISKAEYIYMLPEDYPQKDYFFIRNYEAAEWSRTGNQNEMPGMQMLWVKPESPVIRFYNKLFLSENLQSIRTFFLTEIFTFFLYILGQKLLKLSMIKYRMKNGRSFIFKSKDYLNISGLYAFLLFSSIIILIVICQSPTKEINDIKYKEKPSFSILKPYDISQTYYHMNILPEKLTGEPIEWRSNEMVEFSAMPISPNLISSNSIYFSDYDKTQPFINVFYTKNLVSKNIQDIRLFFVTTMLLIFFARLFVNIKFYILSFHPQK